MPITSKQQCIEKEM